MFYLLLFLLIVSYLVIPVVILWALVTWRGNWRAAALLPVIPVALIVMIADERNRGTDSAEGIGVILTVLGATAIYYVVLVVRHWRMKRSAT